eukprot:3887758-Ditylum_brightwellii.AAC.1
MAVAYRTIADKDFVHQTPPLPSVLPPFAAVQQANEENRQYMEEMKKFETFKLVAQAFKKQLIGAFDSCYFLLIYNQVTGYKDSTVLELLEHLYNNYGQVDTTILTANDQELHADFNPSISIKKYIACVENCLDIAANERAPYTEEQ